MKLVSITLWNDSIIITRVLCHNPMIPWYGCFQLSSNPLGKIQPRETCLSRLPKAATAPKDTPEPRHQTPRRPRCVPPHCHADLPPGGSRQKVKSPPVPQSSPAPSLWENKSSEYDVIERILVEGDREGKGEGGRGGGGAPFPRRSQEPEEPTLKHLDRKYAFNSADGHQAICFFTTTFSAAVKEAGKISCFRLAVLGGEVRECKY